MGWWLDYFDPRYLPIFPKTFIKSTTEQEVQALQQILPAPPARVLDAGCGMGRHSIRLAEIGYTVTGLDQVSALIVSAREQARARGLTINFVEGQHTKHPWNAEFDAVINIFTSFGYSEEETENQAVLDAWAHALCAGGCLIIDVSHRDQVIRNYRANFWYTLENGTEIRVQRHFDAIRGLNTIDEYWHTADGQAGLRSHTVRVYSATELGIMLEQAGLRPIQWYGDFSLNPFTYDSPHMIIVAEKQSDI
jgi:SAM-dependent methyltransferase